ncbi:allantoinase AllB [Frondihabitans sp. VKM Ac-2883]|uniref:allantoinase AllB n=1 Tax=Frondihabitans sp. VKM Ac-2883 TaxID=2783823 RepID=UPI00188B930A|nr:allantoinase AllB [Frondihabitans sp. VKM Ac-2883]MBF4577284.1 allantoinase AllB [Frondihabitans sp. VKM Ac-2883]
MTTDAAPIDLVIRSESVLIDGAFRPAAVSVMYGRITAIDDIDSAVTALEDRTLPEGQVLIPGIVDTHVHVNEPGRTDWEGFASATKAALKGGVTTIIDMPLNSIPPTTTPEALELKRAAAGPQASVDVGFWGGAIPSSLGHLRGVHDAGVFGFKAFLSPSGVDEFPHLSTEQLHEAMAEIAAFDGLLIVHAEDPTTLDSAPHPEGTDYAAFVRSRPDSSEQAAIDHVIEAVRRTGGRAHILHLSSAAALPAIRAAKAEGLRLTVETCPHYLSFEEEHIPDGGTQYKCCPPIRDAANQEQLWAALVDGTIDLVASDHSPSTAELKFAGDGDFDLAWGGISGLELSFRAVWTGARTRGIPLETVVGWMATSTADLVGLGDRGRIAVGAQADLVAFDPEAPFTVDATALAHKNPVSAFDGAALVGSVETVWQRGVAGGGLVGQLVARP